MQELKDQNFIKQLVSNDRATRNKASKAFLNWLCQHSNAEFITYRKLWKALFYSMYII